MKVITRESTVVRIGDTFFEVTKNVKKRVWEIRDKDDIVLRECPTRHECLERIKTQTV